MTSRVPRAVLRSIQSRVNSPPLSQQHHWRAPSLANYHATEDAVPAITKPTNEHVEIKPKRLP